MDFNSHTDIVVARAATLVNLATEGDRRGKPYQPPAGTELVAAMAEAIWGRPDDHRVLNLADVAELTAVAHSLRVVFESVASSDLDTAARQVNRLLQETQARPLLDRHDNEPWHIHFHAAKGGYAANAAASCATGLAVVLGGEFHDRLGVCTAPQCDRVYVDTSRNGTRRFCSTSCQNRVKTAAFRARGQSANRP